MSITEPKKITIGRYALSYMDNERMDAPSPAIVLVPGWCHDHRVFAPLTAVLDAKFRVVTVNWRGHGLQPYDVHEEFGSEEQARDALAILDQIGVDAFIPVSHSQSGWALIQLLELAGRRRAPRAIALDWLMLPASPEFKAVLDGLRDPSGWRDAVQLLFQIWMNGSSQERVRHHLDVEMKDYTFNCWGRSGRVVAEGYAKHGSPLQGMASLSEVRPIRHVFSTPRDASYEQLQKDFAADHPWFSYASLGGPTHFPEIDVP